MLTLIAEIMGAWLLLSTITVSLFHAALASRRADKARSM